jgi:hypothetical protein
MWLLNVYQSRAGGDARASSQFHPDEYLPCIRFRDWSYCVGNEFNGSSALGRNRIYDEYSPAFMYHSALERMWHIYDSHNHIILLSCCLFAQKRKLTCWSCGTDSSTLERKRAWSHQIHSTPLAWLATPPSQRSQYYGKRVSS